MEMECKWTQDSDGHWETGCRKLFTFIEDGPAQNGFEYCPYCGGKLTIPNETDS